MLQHFPASAYETTSELFQTILILYRVNLYLYSSVSLDSRLTIIDSYYSFDPPPFFLFYSKINKAIIFYNPNKYLCTNIAQFESRFNFPSQFKLFQKKVNNEFLFFFFFTNLMDLPGFIQNKKRHFQLPAYNAESATKQDYYSRCIYFLPHPPPPKKRVYSFFYRFIGKKVNPGGL